MWPHPQMWVLKHPPTNSLYAVEYGRKDGKLAVLSHGFTRGNVVSLDQYRMVRARAREMFE